MVFSGFSRGIFHHGHHVNLSEYASNAVKLSEAFRDITWFKYCTDVNLFKYELNVIQNWEVDGYFLLAVMVEGCESSQLRMAN